MGSGGLVVLDDSDCMVDIARYFLQFTQDESCGKCTFCRIGTQAHARDPRPALRRARASAGDLEKLEELADTVKPRQPLRPGPDRAQPGAHHAALLPRRVRGAPRRAAARPAAARRSSATAITDDCIGCTLCAQHCPVDAIAVRPYERHEIDDDLCTRCDICRQACPEDAIEVE